MYTKINGKQSQQQIFSKFSAGFTLDRYLYTYSTITIN